MSIILCIALVLPCVSNALDKSYLEDFKRIEDYLEENYDLTDHRGDPVYDGWVKDNEEYELYP